MIFFNSESASVIAGVAFQACCFQKCAGSSRCLGSCRFCLHRSGVLRGFPAGSHWNLTLGNSSLYSGCRWSPWIIFRAEYWSQGCAQSSQWCTAEDEAGSTLQEFKIFCADKRNSGPEEEPAVLSFSLKLGEGDHMTTNVCSDCLCRHLWTYLLQNKWKRREIVPTTGAPMKPRLHVSSLVTTPWLSEMTASLSLLPSNTHLTRP